MSAVLRTIPGLAWVAVIWIGVGLWANDVRALYIAVFCLLLAGVQLFRRLRSGG